MKKILLAWMLVSLCFTSFGQAGSLDPSFGNQGLVRTDFGSPFNQYGIGVTTVLLLPDNSFYLVLESTEQVFIVHRFANGALDTGFGQDGYAGPVRMRNPKGVLQPDGKVVVAGYALHNESIDFVVARFLTNGSLDKSFSGDGIQVTDLYNANNVSEAIALQPDGKIVIAGYNNVIGGNFAVFARYNPDGSLDNSFSGDGKLSTDFTVPEAIAIQNDGRIVVVGTLSHVMVGRYMPDGSVDNSFAGTGKRIITFAYFTSARGVAVQSDGKIVVGGTTLEFMGDENFAIARLNVDGSFDNSFSGDGKQTTDLGSFYDEVEDLKIQPDGKIVVAGSTRISDGPDFAVARYTSDGTLDNSFSGDGIQVTAIGYSADLAFSVALQQDSKILVAGWSVIINNTQYSVAWYQANGTLDNSFDGDGLLTGYRPGGYTYYLASAMQPDGKIVAAGYCRITDKLQFAVARYLPDGSLDNSFSDDGKTAVEIGADPARIFDVAIQADGKIVAVGSASNGSNSDIAIARLNADGTVDNSFSGDGLVMSDIRGYYDELRAVAIQPDGKIVVAGHSELGNNVDFLVMRYNANGTPDNTFSGDGIIVTGFGSLGGEIGDDVAIQADGKIVVGGSYDYNYNANFALARYTTDGLPDPTFDGDGLVITDIMGNRDVITALLVQTDGKIVVTGALTVGGVGNELVVARYNANGSFDNSFSGDGKLVFDGGSTTESLHSIAIQPDGKYIAAGQLHGGNNNDLLLVRVNTNGTPDNSFSGDGIVKIDLGYGIDIFESVHVWNNRAYAAGGTVYGGYMGLAAGFQLTTPCTFSVSIPDAWAMPNGVEPNTVYVGYAPASPIKLKANITEGSGPYSILWNTGATTLSIIVKPEVPRTYTVTVTDANGCSKTAEKFVNVYDVRCGENMDKALVCYVPPGNPSNTHTMCVSPGAVPMHLTNGSMLGGCKMYVAGDRGSDDLSVSRATAGIEISAYPNPAKRFVNLDIKGDDRGQMELVIWDAFGTMVEKRFVVPGTVQVGATYRPRVYMIELRKGRERVMLRIVKMSD